MSSPRFFSLATTLAIGIVKISMILPPAVAGTKTLKISNVSGEKQFLATPSPWKISPRSPAKFLPLLVLPFAVGFAAWMIKNKNI
ncbi:hypothetical protein [Pannus brasiliensis]|uniref:hypothetical protein n=1 Tax=Pannus brasiliensis TaxID=1579216 RepID=UPI002FCD8111